MTQSALQMSLANLSSSSLQTPIPDPAINPNTRELIQTLPLLNAPHVNNVPYVVEVPQVKVDGWEDDEQGADDVTEEGSDEGFADVCCYA